MDECLEEVHSTGIFVCFCVSMELDCLDLICIDVRVSKCDNTYRQRFLCYIFVFQTYRFARNEDVLDLDTSFERFDVYVIYDCNAK